MSANGCAHTKIFKRIYAHVHNTNAMLKRTHWNRRRDKTIPNNRLTQNLENGGVIKKRMNKFCFNHPVVAISVCVCVCGFFLPFLSLLQVYIQLIFRFFYSYMLRLLYCMCECVCMRVSQTIWIWIFIVCVRRWLPLSLSSYSLLLVFSFFHFACVSVTPILVWNIEIVCGCVRQNAIQSHNPMWKDAKEYTSYFIYYNKITHKTNKK